MKKILTLLAFALMAGAAFAQTADVEEEVIYEKNNHKVVTNTFWDNWWVQLGAGAQIYYGDHNKHVDFVDRLSLALDAGFGKWFSPQIGVRAMISGLSVNGATQTWLQEDGGVHATGNTIPGKYTHDYGYLVEQQFDFYNLHADVLFNMSNILCGYKEKRVWNCSPYIGVGWMVTWNSPRAREVSLNLGIFNAIRLSDKFDFNIDLRTTMVKDGFDGEVGGRKEEGLWTATAGFSYKFKQRGWDRSKTIIRNNRAEANALQKQLEALQRENDGLRNDLANAKGKEIRVVEKEATVSPVLVTFEIGKSKLSNQARVTLGLLAKAIKDSDNKLVYTIAGYADAGTGSKKINQKLSEERAQAVYNCLTEEFGVDESQLRVVSKGGVENMYYDDPRLSRAVIMGANAEAGYDIEK
ncbi:MAG: OmpA family protein [Rikenellaceae bacterium]|nr:OmpA family protein [Rikenellaceae bacterium]